MGAQACACGQGQVRRMPEASGSRRASYGLPAVQLVPVQRLPTHGPAHANKCGGAGLGAVSCDLIVGSSCSEHRQPKARPLNIETLFSGCGQRIVPAQCVQGPVLATRLPGPFTPIACLYTIRVVSGPASAVLLQSLPPSCLHLELVPLYTLQRNGRHDL